MMNEIAEFFFVDGEEDEGHTQFGIFARECGHPVAFTVGFAEMLMESGPVENMPACNECEGYEPLDFVVLETGEVCVRSKICDHCLEEFAADPLHYAKEN
jgi:hypothetical protein